MNVDFVRIFDEDVFDLFVADEALDGLPIVFNSRHESEPARRDVPICAYLALRQKRWGRLEKILL